MNFIGVVNDFRRLGCEAQSKCASAARVYADLRLDKCNIDIHKNYDRSLDMLYIRVHSIDNTSTIILPTLCSHEINVQKIKKFQEKLNDAGRHKLLLAICDTSSNILYYNLAQKQTSKATRILTEP